MNHPLTPPPVPPQPWLIAQTLADVCFFHWPVPAASLQPHIPAPLSLDCHDGTAWISIVAFRVQQERLRFLPPIPGLSSYLQLNLRTYVTYGAEPGVFFFSCDVSSWLHALSARMMWHLPYLPARLQFTARDQRTSLVCERPKLFTPAARFEAQMHPSPTPAAIQPGSLANWLTARFSQYLIIRGALHRGDIRHAPWPLQQAEGVIQANTLPASIQLPNLDESPLCHYAFGVTAHVWPFVQLDSGKHQ